MFDVYGYQIATVPVICTAIYGIIEVAKKWIFANNEVFKKYIPVIACFGGAIISFICFFAVPDAIPTQTWYGALVIGGASGLSAVGVNQIKKQIQKDGNDGT